MMNMMKLSIDSMNKLMLAFHGLYEFNDVAFHGLYEFYDVPFH